MNGTVSELNAGEEGRCAVGVLFGWDLMWCTRPQKRYLSAQRHTCLLRHPRTSTSRSDPWPPGRPDGVSLVPFDSPDPPVSARRIDFLREEVAARLLLAPPLQLSRGQPSVGRPSIAFCRAQVSQGSIKCDQATPNTIRPLTLQRYWHTGIYPVPGKPLSKRYLLLVFIGGSATATWRESGANL